MKIISRTEFAARVGHEIGLSPWIEITQDCIDRFAECTGDRQFIHVDPERMKQTPLGGTIAHGFLTVSLLGAMVQAVPRIAGAVMNLNYGMDRLRFVSPVPSGSRIRGRFVLATFEDISPREVQTMLNVTVEIEGKDKPALIADWLFRRYFA